MTNTHSPWQAWTLPVAGTLTALSWLSSPVTSISLLSSLPFSARLITGLASFGTFSCLVALCFSSHADQQKRFQNICLACFVFTVIASISLSLSSKFSPAIARWCNSIAIFSILAPPLLKLSLLNQKELTQLSQKIKGCLRKA